MDVTVGFTQGISFYDIAIERVGSVTVYSGLDGTGAVLATLALPTTPEAFGSATTLTFDGIAESVKFTGGNDQLVLDNITLLAPVPEPAAWISLTAGLASASVFFARRR